MPATRSCVRSDSFEVEAGVLFRKYLELKSTAKACISRLSYSSNLRDITLTTFRGRIHCVDALHRRARCKVVSLLENQGAVLSQAIDDIVHQGAVRSMPEGVPQSAH